MYGFQRGGDFDAQYRGTFVGFTVGGSPDPIPCCGISGTFFSSVYENTNIPNFDITGIAYGVSVGEGLPVSAFAFRTVYEMDQDTFKSYLDSDETVKRLELLNDIITGQGTFFGAFGILSQARIQAASVAMVEATRYELFELGTIK